MCCDHKDARYGKVASHDSARNRQRAPVSGTPLSGRSAVERFLCWHRAAITRDDASPPSPGIPGRKGPMLEGSGMTQPSDGPSGLCLLRPPPFEWDPDTKRTESNSSKFRPDGKTLPTIHGSSIPRPTPAGLIDAIFIEVATSNRPLLHSIFDGIKAQMSVGAGARPELQNNRGQSVPGGFIGVTPAPCRPLGRTNTVTDRRQSHVRARLQELLSSHCWRQKAQPGRRAATGQS